MPPAVAVMVELPVIGLPELLTPLQSTKVESQTPPQIKPAGETVATAVFDELNVKVVLTALPAEFTAEGVTVVTCPATREAVVGFKTTCATVLLLFEEEPPQPAMKTARKRRIRANLACAGRSCAPKTARPLGRLKLRWISINIEEFSV